MLPCHAALLTMPLANLEVPAVSPRPQDLPYLLTLDEAGLKEVAATVSMKPGHAAKFIAMLPSYRPAAAEPRTSVEPV